jgi:hypothetical protein
MSAGLDSSGVVELVSAVAQQSFNPTAMSRLVGHPVVRSPEQLRLHPAMKELGWTGVIDEFNAAARLKDQPGARGDSDHDERLYSRWQGALAVSAFGWQPRNQLYRVPPR